MLLSPGLAGLTPGHCERVRSAGVRLVGLALDQRDTNALASIGVDLTVESSVSREELIAATQGETHEPAAPPAVAASPSRVQRPEDAGSVLAVIGGRGAPGASECAASLAALAHDRWPTVLVEVDALGGGLDVRLGADAHQGSLLGLVRASSSQDGGGALRELVEHWLTSREGWPPVLLAPPDSEALAECAEPGRDHECTARALRAVPGRRRRRWFSARRRCPASRCRAHAPRSTDSRRRGTARARRPRGAAAPRPTPTRPPTRPACDPARAAARHRQRRRCPRRSELVARSSTARPTSSLIERSASTRGCRGTVARSLARAVEARRSPSPADAVPTPARSRGCLTSCSCPPRRPHRSGASAVCR